MLTVEELTRIRETATDPDTIRLVSEIERLKHFIQEYGESITRKMDAVEAQMIALEKENQRLVTIKNGAYVERDACVALLARLALKSGLKAGIAGDHTLAVQLPSGQVSWKIDPSENHLLEGLPAFDGAVEGVEIEETYRRIMNPEVQ